MKIQLTILFLIINLSFSSNSLRAQKIDSKILKMINSKIIHSKVLNQKRKLFIYKPQIDIFSEAPLPVLHMMDGENIGMVAGIVDSLINSGDFPPMIIVGIANYKDERTNDLTPVPLTTNQYMYGTKSGGGNLFLKFIKDEVIPFVNRDYKTSNEKILFGHSFGGLMSVYCLFMYPELFNDYIAVSPSLWWENEFIMQKADSLFKLKNYTNKNIFICDGTEDPNFKFVPKLDSLLQKNKQSGLEHKYITYKNETHNSQLVKATQDGIRFIIEKWKPSKTDTTAEMVVKFYANRSKQSGFQKLPPEQLINTMGYTCLSNPIKIDEAIKFFELNAKNYPESFTVFDSLGDGYSAKKDNAKAIKAYKKAIDINPKSMETIKKLKTLE
jgi:predicted alpha/beta superfamily hydrolase